MALWFDFIRARSWQMTTAFVLLVAGASARAAFDAPASWEVTQNTDFHSENHARYDAPWHLLQSHLTSETFDRILMDSDGRISPEFRVPKELEAQVRLWLSVYTRHSSQEAIIFDEQHPEVVYEILDFRELARTSRNRVAFEIVSRNILKKKLAAYKQAFLELSRKPSRKQRFTYEAQVISKALKNLPHHHPLRESAKNVRVQWGQRDQVMSGILSSSAFLHRMEGIFRGLGVPEELILLSLVESSFNLNAVSTAGATGVWQFMLTSGNEYLLIHPDAQIDERLSPIKSTVAAGRLLTRNYKMLGSWMLAASAYNNGHAKWVRLNSTQRARAPQVLAQCSLSKSPIKLGFASRNYVAEHLALLRAYKYQDVAFGSAPESSLAPIRFVQLSQSAHLTELSNLHNLPETELRRLNPDIKLTARTLPAGYWLGLPAQQDDFAGLIQPKKRRAPRLTEQRNQPNGLRLADAREIIHTN